MIESTEDCLSCDEGMPCNDRRVRANAGITAIARGYTITVISAWPILERKAG